MVGARAHRRPDLRQDLQRGHALPARGGTTRIVRSGVVRRAHHRPGRPLENDTELLARGEAIKTRCSTIPRCRRRPRGRGQPPGVGGGRCRRSASSLRLGLRDVVVAVGQRFAGRPPPAGEAGRFPGRCGDWRHRSVPGRDLQVIAATVDTWDAEETFGAPGAAARTRSAVHPHQRHPGGRNRRRRDPHDQRAPRLNTLESAPACSLRPSDRGPPSESPKATR